MSKKKRVLFIGRGGARAGLGHLVRLDTLVREFESLFDVSFLAQVDDRGRYFLDRREIKYSVYRNTKDLMSFLGGQKTWDTIVVDLYPPEKNLLAALKDYCAYLLCFDDMDHLGETDIPGVILRPQETFNRRIQRKGNTTIVLGRDYFPLRPDVIHSRKSKRFKVQMKNIALVLGGAPQEKSVLALTRLLDGILDRDISLHIVGGFTPSPDELPFSSPRIFVKSNVDAMGRFIQGMDMGIIAGGFVKYEFMCIGTPYAMLSLCSHQGMLGRKFSAQGYGVFWGHIRECLSAPQKMKTKVLSFIADEKRREEISVRSRKLVDGHGSGRILQMVTHLNEGKK